MKAPDKIYIQTNKGEAFSSKWTTIPFRDFENTKYIREDALIEWLEGKMTIEGATEGIVGGYDMALKDVIDHINKF